MVPQVSPCARLHSGGPGESPSGQHRTEPEVPARAPGVRGLLQMTWRTAGAPQHVGIPQGMMRHPPFSCHVAVLRALQCVPLQGITDFAQYEKRCNQYKELLRSSRALTKELEEQETELLRQKPSRDVLRQLQDIMRMVGPWPAVPPTPRPPVGWVGLKAC